MFDRFGKHNLRKVKEMVESEQILFDYIPQTYKDDDCGLL